MANPYEAVVSRRRRRLAPQASASFGYEAVPTRSGASIGSGRGSRSPTISILDVRIKIPRRNAIGLSCVFFCLSLLFLGVGVPSDATLHRWLEEIIAPEDVRFTGTQISTSPTTEVLQHSEILLSTLKLYGTLAALMFVAYAAVRKRCPRAYNVRGTAGTYSPEGVACQKALTYFEEFTSLSWTYRIFRLSHEEIYESAGLDAVSLVRLLEFGTKLSLVGIACSTWLFPVYYFIGENVYSAATASITDPVQNISLANIPPGHHSAIATTVSAYILFGAAMYLIMEEFKWFTSARHRFLTRPRPDNYTVLVSGIPPHFRSDAAVMGYFVECFGPSAVLEAHVVLDAPALEKKVAERDAVLAKLEHAINVRNVKGGGTVGPTHKTGPMGLSGEKVDSIEFYAEELRRLNDDVGRAIEAIEAAQRERDAAAASTLDLPTPLAGGSDNTDEHDLSFDVETTISVVDSVASRSEVKTPQKGKKSGSSHSSKVGDGSPLNAAFVTFADLATTNAALQMIEEHPFVFETLEAPRPSDLEWSNIGLSHARQELGSLLGLTLASLLCLFWTIPVGFVASFSNVSALTELFPPLGAFLETHPWFSSFLAQLAPLLLVIVVAMLPIILQMISKLEGHASLTGIQTSVFTKLSWFTIIQTFFISAISGSVTQEIQAILLSPIHAVDLLARSLPAQSAYFMQIMLVQTLLGGFGIELLRPSAVGMAAVRGLVGPNLTEKERSTTWMGLRPFADPSEYLYAYDLGAEVILLFMVLFCYASMAPLTCYVCGFCFVLLNMVLRNQFLFVYPTKNDSGGKLWIQFMQVMVISMIIAQVALIGVLSLKKNTIAAPLLVPLPIITLLFSIYLKQKHYSVTINLPTKVCVEADKGRATASRDSGSVPDFAFVRGKYLQPALQHKVRLPENLDEKAPPSGAKATLWDYVAGALI